MQGLMADPRDNVSGQSEGSKSVGERSEARTTPMTNATGCQDKKEEYQGGLIGFRGGRQESNRTTHKQGSLDL